MTDTRSLDQDLALTTASAASAPAWRTVLLATDGSPACDDAVSFVREVALRTGAAVHVATVSEPTPLRRDPSAPIFDGLTEGPASAERAGW
jgi:nucleotide-binding universal stress UspA family protein